MVYDNVPSTIIIKEVFQKWAKLEIRFEGEDKEFEDLVNKVHYMSEKICEICSESGGYTIIDGWETTLCDQHYDASTAKKKYKKGE